MARKKGKRPHGMTLVLSSEEAMVAALNRYIETRLKIAAKVAAHEERIARVRTEFDAAIQDEREELALLEASVQLYAVNHRIDLFGEGDKKSKDFANARIGFRDNPPSVGKRVAKDTYDAIALRLDELPWGAPYVSWKVAPNKEALLRDRASLTEEQLKAAGIRFEQDEHFFIDPTSDAIERAKASTEAIEERAEKTAEFLQGGRA